MQSFDLDQAQDLGETHTSTLDQQQPQEAPEISSFSIAPSQNPLQLERSQSQYSDLPQDITQEIMTTQSIFNQYPEYRSLRTESPLWSRFRTENNSITIQLASGPQYRMEPSQDNDQRICANAFSFRPVAGVEAKVENNVKRNSIQQKIGLKSKLEKLLKDKEGLEGVIGLCASLFALTIFPVLIILMISHFGNNIQAVSSSTTAALAYTVHNLNSDPIMEILPVSLNSSCPQNFLPLNLGNWPGTENGCSCPGESIEEGKCQKSDKGNCEDVFALDDVDIYGWGGSFWCARRALLNVDYVKEAVCPPGFTECSLGICIKEGLECPISSISLIDNGSDVEYKLEGYNKYLTVSRTIGQAPLVEIDITLNNIPCFSANRMALGTQQPYLLLNFKSTGCDKYGLDDKFSFKIDYKNQEQVLQDNNFSDQILSLPGYQAVLQNTPAVLSGRNRIPVANKGNCLSINAILLDEARVSTNAAQLTISILSIIALILHVLIVNSLLIAISRQRRDKCCIDIFRGRNPKVWFKCFSCLGFIEILSFIAALVLLFYFRSVITKSNSYIQELLSSECFQEWQPKTVIQDYSKLLESSTTEALKYFLALVGISVVTYIPVITLNGCKKKYGI